VKNWLAAFTRQVHTESMSTRTTLALAIAAGFIGGVASQRIMPIPVRAQEQASVPHEIRAHKFVLVDDAGVDRGVFGFNSKAAPDIEMMDPKGHTWTYQGMSGWHKGMLPDATCSTCLHKPAKDSTPSADGAT
jgi:hypothetical protein